MKVFVATQERAWTANDFSYVPEGELVMPYVGWELLSVCDSGAPRSLVGTKTSRATTTFKVVEKKITSEELAEIFFATFKAQKWLTAKHLFPFKNAEKAWRSIARSFARSIMRAASKFPVGNTVGKDYCTYRSRTNPSLKARVLVTLQRNLQNI